MEQQLRFCKYRVLIIVAALIIFAATFYCVVTSNFSWFDDPIRKLFYDLRTSFLTPLVVAITYLGNWQVIMVLCVVLLIIGPTRFKYGLPLSIGALAVTSLNKAIKHLVARPRPDDIMHLIDVGGFSFTSGHSITSMFFYAMIIYLVRRYVKRRSLANTLTVLSAIPLIFIGLSRIYLGVHYPTDVLGGWCLGIIAMITATMIIEGHARQKALQI